MQAAPIIADEPKSAGKIDEETTEVLKVIHRATSQVGKEIETLRFNRAVAQIYEMTNAITRFLPQVAETPDASRIAALRTGVENLIQLIAPMTPHLAESCWEALGKDGLVCDALWPVADEKYLSDDTITMPVQINGKKRGEITLPKDTAQDVVEQQALSLDAIARMLDGKTPKRVIVVPNRIVNVVV